MKRPILIIVGAVTIFILMAVWVYVLFFSSPNNNPETFSNLNIGNTTDPNYVAPVPIEEDPVVDVTSPERLRQLTIKPTIGYQEVQKDASSTPAVYYIEAGTGHIFSINIESGEEKRISATTIPASRAGSITPNGQYVMIRSGSGSRGEAVFGTISSTSESLSATKLNETVIDFTATTDNTFLLAIQTSNSVIGKEYSPQTATFETLFTIPFREAVIVWGNTADDIHYTYPKASSQLEGFLYEIKKGKVNRLPIDGFGLTAAGRDEGIIYSKQLEGAYKSFIHTAKQGSVQFVFGFLPDKCRSQNLTPSNLICGGSLTTLNNQAPDSWYQGTISYRDNLWLIDTELADATLLSDTRRESGREIDITNININPTDLRTYFINKRDNTLWLYEL